MRPTSEYGPSATMTQPVRKAAVVKSEGVPSKGKPLDQFATGTVGIVISVPPCSCVGPGEPFIRLTGRVYFLNEKVWTDTSAHLFIGRPLEAHEYVELRNV